MGTVIGLGAGTSSGSGGSKAILVKQVQAGDSFPTTRQDGTPLVLGDWVTPKGTLPFTIGTVTFSTYKDTASWTGVEWLLNANPFQKTSETPVNNKAAESVSGTANYQNQINIENKAKFDTKIDKIDTAVSIEHAVVKKSDGNYGLMQVNINANAGLAIVRRDLDKQINVPLVPAGDDDAVSKQYADTKTAQVSTLATPTTAMIGKAPVQYIGATDETATPKLYHGYYYEVVSNGAGGAKWENINVSKGVMPYLNGVLLDGDKNTEQVRVSFKGTRAEWNALPMSQKKCRFAVIEDEESIPQLHIALVMNDTTGKLKAQLWDTTDAVKVAESSEVLIRDNESLHTGAFVTTIPAGQTGVGKHGIKFTKADGTTMNLVLEDSADKLITAIDTATLQNKTISSDSNTIKDLKTADFKGGVVSTEISPAASASDTKLPTEKAVRTEIDKKQDILVASDNITIAADGKTIKSNQIDDTLSTSTTKTWSIDAIKEGIRVMAATFRGTFATKAALDAYSGVKENNDRAVVTTDETQGDKTTMYIFNGTSWLFEYVISDKPIELDDSTIHINASGKIEVKDDGISPAKMKQQDVSKEGFGLTVKNDGTIDYERIRQYKAVTTFASEAGNTETLYHLTVPCIIGTKSYSAGIYTWSSATGFSLAADVGGGGGGGTTPILVGVVSPGGFMPTLRPDGSALVIGDFVKPYSEATFPFTVSGVTFNSKNDSAVYMTAGNWLVNATVFQKTNETPINDKATESIDGAASTAVYQAGINAENATAINAAAKTATFEKTSDGKIHLNIKSRSNTDIVEANIEKVVFEDDTQTLKNKTVNADDNTLSNIETDNFKTGVISTGIASTSTDTQLPTAKAAYVAVGTAGHKVTMTVKDAAQFIYTLSLLDRSDNVLSTQDIDFPFELIKVISLEYDNTNEKLIMKWQGADGTEHTLEVPASGILKGIVTQTAEQTLTNKTIEASGNKIDPIVEAASLPATGAKKSFYMRTADNTLWYTRDGGTTWIEVGKGFQYSSLPTPTVAMIGKDPVQYTGPDDTAATPALYHGRFYEVVADGTGAKWQELNVSKGVVPYINGVLLDGNKNTEDIRIAFKGTRAQWNALSEDERKCRFAVITDETTVPQLHIKNVFNSATAKLKSQLWDEADTTLVYESPEVSLEGANVLIAKYDLDDPTQSTPYTDVLAAFNAGKTLFAKSGYHIYPLQYFEFDEFAFCGIDAEDAGKLKKLTCKTYGWETGEDEIRSDAVIYVTALPTSDIRDNVLYGLKQNCQTVCRYEILPTRTSEFKFAEAGIVRVDNPSFIVKSYASMNADLESGVTTSFLFGESASGTCIRYKPVMDGNKVICQFHSAAAPYEYLPYLHKDGKWFKLYSENHFSVAGGELIGAMGVRRSSEYPSIYGVGENNPLKIWAAKDGNGAGLELKYYTGGVTNTGVFSLSACGEDGAKVSLEGDARDKTLKWNGNEVLTGNGKSGTSISARSLYGLFMLNIGGNLAAICCSTYDAVVNGMTVSHGTSYLLGGHTLTNAWNGTTKTLTVTVTGGSATMGLLGM